MGNFPSKDIQDCLGSVDLSSPLQKETPVRIRVLDPRSPSEGIPRTPIEVLIKKSSQSQTSVADPNTPEIFLKKRYLYSQPLLDPRSPTFSFDRTPIQVAVQSMNEDVHLEPCETEPAEEENLATCVDVVAGCKAEDVLPDPRSPSVDITRTPIQMTETLKKSSMLDIQCLSSRKGLLETDLDAEISTTQLLTNRNGNKCVDAKTRTPDRNLYVARDKRAAVVESELEKENEQSLKRKLFATPESSPVIQAGLKVRNPLGSMSNYQQAPSVLLKMKQTWKIEQSARAVIYDLEGTPNSKQASRNERQIRRQQVVEWDKDSTVII